MALDPEPFDLVSFDEIGKLGPQVVVQERFNRAVGRLPDPRCDALIQILVVGVKLHRRADFRHALQCSERGHRGEKLHARAVRHVDAARQLLAVAVRQADDRRVASGAVLVDEAAAVGVNLDRSAGPCPTVRDKLRARTRMMRRASPDAVRNLLRRADDVAPRRLAAHHVSLRVLQIGEALAFGAVEAANLLLAFRGAVVDAGHAAAPHRVNALLCRRLAREIPTRRFLVLKAASLRARKSVDRFLVLLDVMINPGRVAFPDCVNPCH